MCIELLEQQRNKQFHHKNLIQKIEEQKEIDSEGEGESKNEDSETFSDIKDAYSSSAGTDSIAMVSDEDFKNSTALAHL